MAFDVRGEHSGRRLRRASGHGARFDQPDARAAPRQLLRDGTADDPAAHHDDVPAAYVDHTGRGQSLGTVKSDCPRLRRSGRTLAIVDDAPPGVLMPRRARQFIDGLPYHVLNRGNRRQRVFSQHSDYEMFLTTLADAVARWPVRLLAFALMPNHFHLVLWPAQGIAISAFMRWMMNAHIRRHLPIRRAEGHRASLSGPITRRSPIQTDSHLLTVLQIRRSQSVAGAARCNGPSTGDGPVSPETPRWMARRLVAPSSGSKAVELARTSSTRTMASADRDALRQAVQRQVPFGDPEWIRSVDSGTVTRDSHE